MGSGAVVPTGQPHPDGASCHGCVSRVRCALYVVVLMLGYVTFVRHETPHIVREVQRYIYASVRPRLGKGPCWRYPIPTYLLTDRSHRH